MASNGTAKLLVSVRDAAEAEIALAAGAALIDVKEPRRGALGAADRKTMQEVALAVASRVPVSVALGELVECDESRCDELQRDGGALVDLPEGVTFAKVGLAACANVKDWESRWIAQLAALPAKVRPVAVMYADWRTAAAPSPEEVLRAVATEDCAAVLIDTFDKSGGDLFSHWSESELQDVIGAIRSVAPMAVVGGSLRGASVARAAACGPDYVAVRGAACRGGRSGVVDAACVRELVETLRRPFAVADEP